MDKELYLEMRAMEDHHWWFTARREILTSILRTQIPLTNLRILEIGCGTGGNLEMLSRFGQLSALEPQVNAWAMAKARGICPVYNLPLNEQFNPEQPVELACMLDVLEHIEDQQQALAHVRRILTPGGRLLLTVPAFQFLWSGHDEKHHHYRRYRRPQLVELLTREGFRVDYCSYFNTLLFPLITSVRLLQKTIGMEGSHVTATSKPLNTLLHHLFAFERRLLARWTLPFGVSVVTIASLSE
ncbi:class I SAM-dependent methyltransferase [Pseudomaricurvus alkylphenolicus]|uniref:class I SAM-dependent methyltransferase n=1 Tax=Pseudomaricurvus alkylphenolicus TaxID=1306991 RepID=UPI00141E10AE|nr:class I SAM-dependent methyltransferase [Pseudomaricurvus alkylphenolicus]NIB40024.1 class I SAM-dependent methyltransferase [Pseudomaricurvus alkylphenolicus]